MTLFCESKIICCSVIIYKFSVWNCRLV